MPVPRGPPANTLKMGSILPRAPPPLSRTMPACALHLVRRGRPPTLCACWARLVVHLLENCLHTLWRADAQGITLTEPGPEATCHV